jgi:hypothetical protein
VIWSINMLILLMVTDLTGVRKIYSLSEICSFVQASLHVTKQQNNSIDINDSVTQQVFIGLKQKEFNPIDDPSVSHRSSVLHGKEAFIVYLFMESLIFDERLYHLLEPRYVLDESDLTHFIESFRKKFPKMYEELNTILDPSFFLDVYKKFKRNHFRRVRRKQGKPAGYQVIRQLVNDYVNPISGLQPHWSKQELLTNDQLLTILNFVKRSLKVKTKYKSIKLTLALIAVTFSNLKESNVSETPSDIQLHYDQVSDGVSIVHSRERYLVSIFLETAMSEEQFKHLADPHYILTQGDLNSLVILFSQKCPAIYEEFHAIFTPSFFLDVYEALKSQKIQWVA